jgi:hypothetical protein
MRRTGRAAIAAIAFLGRGDQRADQAGGYRAAVDVYKRNFTEPVAVRWAATTVCSAMTRRPHSFLRPFTRG